jgi:hypothetical protein
VPDFVTLLTSVKIVTRVYGDLMVRDTHSASRMTPCGSARATLDGVWVISHAASPPTTTAFRVRVSAEEHEATVFVGGVHPRCATKVSSAKRAT